MKYYVKEIDEAFEDKFEACIAASKVIADLPKYLKRNSEGKCVCGLCGEEFNNEKDLVTHLGWDHGHIQEVSENVLGYIRLRPKEQIYNKLGEILEFCEQEKINLTQVYIDHPRQEDPDLYLRRMLRDYESYESQDIDKIVVRDLLDLGRTTTSAIKRLESLLIKQNIKFIFIEKYLNSAKPNDYNQIKRLIGSFYTALEKKNEVPKKRGSG